MAKKSTTTKMQRKQKFKVREYRVCPFSGRTRGLIRLFGDMSRIEFRKKALRGEIPGVSKISW